jgi:hypothetical protein
MALQLLGDGHSWEAFMKKIALGLVGLLVACGGAGDTDIDGGSDTGTGNDAIANDSGTDAAPIDSSTSDAPTFNVQSVVGLVIWLEGDLASSITTQAPDGGGTATILQWKDQTSHHNDAKGIPEALARNPTVKASAIHGLSAIHFNKTGANATTGNILNISNNTDSSLQWSTGDFYVAIVGDFDNNPADGPSDGVGNFFAKTPINSASITGTAFFGNVPGNGAPTAGLVFETSAAAGDSVTTSTAYNNGAPHLFAIRRQSGKMDLFVDEVSVASTTPQSPVDQNNVFSVAIGAQGDANQVRLDGDIGEIVAVKDVLAPNDEAGIEAYLKAKWATP